MDNRILFPLPARGWVSLTTLKLIVNFGGFQQETMDEETGHTFQFKVLPASGGL